MGPLYWISILLYVTPPSVEISIVPVVPASKFKACVRVRNAVGVPIKLKTGVSIVVLIVPDDMANFPLLLLSKTTPLNVFGPFVSLQTLVEVLFAFAGKPTSAPFCLILQPGGLAVLKVPSTELADGGKVVIDDSTEESPTHIAGGVAETLVGG